MSRWISNDFFSVLRIISSKTTVLKEGNGLSGRPYIIHGNRRLVEEPSVSSFPWFCTYWPGIKRLLLSAQPHMESILYIRDIYFVCYSALNTPSCTFWIPESPTKGHAPSGQTPCLTHVHLLNTSRALCTQYCSRMNNSSSSTQRLPKIASKKHHICCWFFSASMNFSDVPHKMKHLSNLPGTKHELLLLTISLSLTVTGYNEIFMLEN